MPHTPDHQQQAPQDPMAAINAILAQSLVPQADAGELAGISEEAIGGYFDPNFFGEREVPGMRGAVPSGVPTTINRPFYKNGDEWRALQNLPPEVSMAQLQDRLHVVGLLDEYRPGQFDANGSTIKAMRTLLAMSNRAGMDWNAMLTTVETGVANGSMQPLNADDSKLTAPEFEKVPDYATLQNRVTRQMRDVIGRDPTEAEMRMFTDQLMADFQAQAQQDFEQQVNTREIDPEVGAGRVPTRPEIDPFARFEQAFEQRMAGDIQTIERQAGVQGGAESARASIAASDQITGT